MIKSKLFIVILSKKDEIEKREIIDKTWGRDAKNAGIDYAFLIGYPKRKNARLTKGILGLVCEDSYNHLPTKMKLTSKWVTDPKRTPRYDHVFKCDNDTYVSIPRLLAYYNETVSGSTIDYIGRKVDKNGTASGGAGYFLSDTALKIVAKSDINTGAEDVEVAKLLKKNDIDLVELETLDPWGKDIPTPDNTIITSHYITPEKMLSIYKTFNDTKITNIAGLEDVIKGNVVEVDPPDEIVPVTESVPAVVASTSTRDRSDAILSGTITDWVGGNCEPLRYNGDYSKQSNVVVIGSYQHGFFEKFLPLYPTVKNVYYFDPIPEYYSYLKKNKYKVKYRECAVDDVIGKRPIFLKHASTSFYNRVGPSRRVDCIKLSDFIQESATLRIDFLMLNCEGAEYGILEDLLNTGFINIVKKIQVQFHDNVPKYSDRRNTIIDRLSKLGFFKNYSFPFVWEEFER